MKNQAAIARLRREHLGRALYELNRAYKQITLPYIRQHGFADFSEAQLTLLSQVDLEGPTPGKVLVARLGISKQAVSKMLRQCEKDGYIKRVRSPTDARANDIVFCRRGRKLMQTAAGAIHVAQRRFRSRLGVRQYDQLKSALDHACETLDLIRVDEE